MSGARNQAQCQESITDPLGLLEEGECVHVSVSMITHTNRITSQASQQIAK